MKVKLEDRYREFYTLEDLDHARAVIASEKEDEETPAGWLAYAAREVAKDQLWFVSRIIEASAHTARNRFAWNAYGETGNMDIWIEGLAETDDGFLKVGAYLTDIWQTGSVDYRDRLYSVRYVRA